MRRTRVKICGLSSEAGVEAAVSAGADAIGLVFFEPSPRNVAIAHAAELRRGVPPFVATVALFVDPEPRLVREVLLHVKPDLLQFHGDEGDDACAQFGRPFLKAVAVGPGVDLLNFATRYPRAAGLVLDTPSEGRGGSGKAFDWSLVPGDVAHRAVLSGGLNAANVGAAIAAVRPYAVDVSSGVEMSKGIKDPVRILRFCEAVRAADDALNRTEPTDESLRSS
jgi:phosphoribosylanthranilate isomerase